MDIISQLQEQVNKIASIAFNTFGTLQRDAPPVRLSTSYPEPASNPSGSEETVNIAEQTKVMSAALVHSAKQFDALVAALPLSEGGEEAQLKRIAELQAENEAVGQELQKQLEAADDKQKGACSILFHSHLRAADKQKGACSILFHSHLSHSHRPDVIPQVLCERAGIPSIEQELKQVQELFNQAADNCLNLKKPD